jgi:hypothetical protein
MNDFEGDFIFLSKPINNANVKGILIELSSQYDEDEIKELIPFWTEKLKVKFESERIKNPVEINMEMKKFPSASTAAKGEKNQIIKLESMYDEEKAIELTAFNFKTVKVSWSLIQKELDFSEDETPESEETEDTEENSGAFE